MKTWIACVGLALALAQSAAAAAPAASCTAPEYRAFDFWVGDWTVTTPTGKVAGTNHVTREYDGCVVHEHYDTGRGYSGESLNIYDAGRKLWHQTWVDTMGTLLVLEGGLRDGKMVLEGQTVGTDAQVTKHRITWTPLGNGSVRQFWESTDAKGNWTVAFDGLYTPKSRP
ncbi:MAG: hypothetical protein JSR18_07570 [Proteobacteria bacterium]|nr:hypothetical protein [Pseudomonadota bacterium]